MIPEQYMRVDGRIKSSAPLEYREMFFLKRAEEEHGDKYDYSKTEYVSAKEKVCIICPLHGEFYQKPNAHLTGNGCPKCAGKNLTTKEIVNRFVSLRGNTYDYSKVDYRGARTLVIIICPTHGEFKQTPNNHVSGDGCPSCAGKDLTTEKVIQNMQRVHGRTYDYGKVVFTNTATKMELVCRVHGSFFQRYHDHLNGHGCVRCGNKVNVIYVWKYREYIKIGVTSKRRKYARIQEVCTAAGWDKKDVELLCYHYRQDCLLVEAQLKVLLKPFKADFSQRFDGYTEIFKNINPKVLQEVLACCVE